MCDGVFQDISELIAGVIEPADASDIRGMKQFVVIRGRKLRLIEHRSHDREVTVGQLCEGLKDQVQPLVDHSTAAVPEKSVAAGFEVFVLEPGPRRLSDRWESKDRLAGVGIGVDRKVIPAGGEILCVVDAQVGRFQAVGRNGDAFALLECQHTIHFGHVLENRLCGVTMKDFDAGLGQIGLEPLQIEPDIHHHIVRFPWNKSLILTVNGIDVIAQIEEGLGHDHGFIEARVTDRDDLTPLLV